MFVVPRCVKKRFVAFRAVIPFSCSFLLLKMALPTFKEDELGRKWDKCLADAVIKLGGGIAIGAVSSLILFKRRAWPVILGSGFGIGLAYGHCERDIASVLSIKSHASHKA